MIPPPFAPPPPRPYAANWTVSRNPAALAIVVGLLAVFIVSAMMLAVFTPSASGMGFAFLPFCGFFVVLLVIIIVAAVGGFGGGMRTLPPPPPIQQPMVPAGAEGPIALNCPNCGAPPSVVDRFGVATCTYCNTRFLVR